MGSCAKVAATKVFDLGRWDSVGAWRIRAENLAESGLYSSRQFALFGGLFWSTSQAELATWASTLLGQPSAALKRPASRAPRPPFAQLARDGL